MPRKPTIDLGPVPEEPVEIARLIGRHLRAASREIDALIDDLAPQPPTRAAQPQGDLFSPSHSPAASDRSRLMRPLVIDRGASDPTPTTTRSASQSECVGGRP